VASSTRRAATGSLSSATACITARTQGDRPAWRAPMWARFVDAEMPTMVPVQSPSTGPAAPVPAGAHAPAGGLGATRYYSITTSGCVVMRCDRLWFVDATCKVQRVVYRKWHNI
jgi:hypothetical protein